MAKKKITEIPKIEKIVISREDVITLAKEKGYSNSILSLYEIQGWIRNKFHLHGEIFFSMFHKKWFINNYFINTSTYKKVEFEKITEMFDTHDDALLIVLYNLLRLC